MQLNNDFVVSEREGLGLATLIARKGAAEALARRMHECFGIEMPQGPHRKTAGNFALTGIGPDSWLAAYENGGNRFATSLRKTLAGVGSVSDQSDSYSVLRITGTKARDTLHKLVPVDVHPRVFRCGQVAVTTAGHISAILWRLDDREEGLPIFEIAVHRSLAASFWIALYESA